MMLCWIGCHKFALTLRRCSCVRYGKHGYGNAAMQQCSRVSGTFLTSLTSLLLYLSYDIM